MIITITTGSIIINCNASRLPLLTLSCKHVELAKGLFDTLKDTFDDKNKFLTTSEIKILAQYIGNHIENTPELIKSGLYNWCFETYASAALTYYDIGNNGYFSEGLEYFDDDDSDDDMSFTKYRHNVTITCLPASKDYVFDYRSELSYIGLNVILAYAYDAKFQQDLSSIAYTADTAYTKKIQKSRGRNYEFVIIVIITIALGSLQLACTFFYYASKYYQNNEKPSEILVQENGESTLVESPNKKSINNDKNLSLWYKNFFAITSLANLILVYAGFIDIITHLADIRSTIHRELFSFGISVHLGIKFVSLVIVWLIFTLAVFLLWAGPVWFDRSIKKVYPDDSKHNNHFDENLPFLKSGANVEMSDLSPNDKLSLNTNPFEEYESDIVRSYSEDLDDYEENDKEEDEEDHEKNLLKESTITTMKTIQTDSDGPFADPGSKTPINMYTNRFFSASEDQLEYSTPQRVQPATELGTSNMIESPIMNK